MEEKRGLAALSFRGHPVVSVKVIDNADFDTLPDLRVLEDSGQLYSPDDRVYMTREAWAKFELLLGADPNATYKSKETTDE